MEDVNLSFKCEEGTPTTTVPAYAIRYPSPSPCGNRSEDLPLGSDCIDGNLNIPVGLKSILFWVVESI